MVVITLPRHLTHLTHLTRSRPLFSPIGMLKAAAPAETSEASNSTCRDRTNRWWLIKDGRVIWCLCLTVELLLRCYSVPQYAMQRGTDRVVPLSYLSHLRRIPPFTPYSVYSVLRATEYCIFLSNLTGRGPRGTPYHRVKTITYHIPHLPPLSATKRLR